MEGAISGKRSPVRRKNIFISSLSDTHIGLKVIFDRPDLISMSDQAI